MSDDFDPDAYLQSTAQGSTAAFDPDAHLAHAVPYTGTTAPPPAYDPTEGMSNYEKFMAGAGKAQFDAWQGLRQIYAKGADFVTGGNRSADIQKEIDESQKLNAPLMKTGAGIAGNVAGALADVVIPAGVASDVAGVAGLTRTASVLSSFANPATVGGAAASGAIQGAVAPVATGGPSRLWNVGAGAAGGAAGNLVSRIPSLLMPPEQAATKAVQALTDAGVPLDAAQRTGSVLLQRAKAMLGDNPLTAGAQRDFADMQSRSFTKAVLKTIGVDADAATPDVMLEAKKAMGATYDYVASKTNIPYDHIEGPLANVETQARLSLNDTQFGVVRRNLDDILQKATQNGGSINGKQFANIKGTLDKLSGGADSDVGQVARDIRQVLHDGLFTSAKDPLDVELLQKTNQQWGNMRKIEGAIATDGSGQISPSKLANILGQKANRYISVYGQGNTALNDLAQAGKYLLPNKVPQSGTVPRAVAQLAVGAAPAVALGAYEGFKEGDWKTAAKYAAGAYLLPKAIQMGLNSPGVAGSVLGGLGKASAATVPASTLVGGAIQHAPYSTLSEMLKARKEPPEGQ